MVVRSGGAVPVVESFWIRNTLCVCSLMFFFTQSVRLEGGCAEGRLEKHGNACGSERHAVCERVVFLCFSNKCSVQKTGVQLPCVYELPHDLACLNWEADFVCCRPYSVGENPLPTFDLTRWQGIQEPHLRDTASAFWTKRSARKLCLRFSCPQA